MNTLELLRKHRIRSYAIFDFVVSFLVVYLLSPLLTKLFLKIGVSVPKRNWLFLTLPFSIVIHLIVGADTPMTKDFLNINDHYILKTVIILLLVLGLIGIEIVDKNN